MPQRSAGLLLHRSGRTGTEVLLVHPGGPFWTRKDDGWWSIPKGEYPSEEAAADAALREFAEETGHIVSGELLVLGEARQPSGKIVTAFALAGNLDAATIRSNMFEMEWPPRSGRRQSFPEIDRAEWFSIPAARKKILPGQAIFLDRLLAELQAA
jgi:predicted NUDIX family NTP pyrophosphohydrolase